MCTGGVQFCRVSQCFGMAGPGQVRTELTCIPEVAIRMAQFSEWEKSYTHTLLYPPTPAAAASPAERRKNFSGKMYAAYLAEMRTNAQTGRPLEQSLLVWHRDKYWEASSDSLKMRGAQSI